MIFFLLTICELTTTLTLYNLESNPGYFDSCISSRIDLKIQAVQTSLADISETLGSPTSSTDQGSIDEVFDSAHDAKWPDDPPAYNEKISPEMKMPELVVKTLQHAPPAVNYQSVSFILRDDRSLCLRTCRCPCHLRGPARHYWQTPAYLQEIIGTLFVGYTGFPVRTMPHHSKECAAQQGAQFEARYIFPSWFLRYCVDICVRKAPTGPSIGLVVKHRIEYAHTNIFHAVNTGNIDRVRQYLDQYPSVANSLEYADGRTPLSIAVELHAVSGAGGAECVRLLLQAGADPDAESDGGETARQVAATNVMTNAYPPEVCRDIEELLSTTQCVEDMDMTHLSQVILGRRVGDVQCLVHVLTLQDSGALDQIDGFGLSALHYAVIIGNFPALRDLVRGGADVNLRSLPHKLTPLYLTAMYDSSTSDQMGRFLLEHGANPRLTTDEGFYPAQMACVSDRLGLITAILEWGFDIDTRTADNRTCLHTAARFDCLITMIYFLERGASLEAVDSKGSTPFMDAATYNSHEVLPILLKHDSSFLYLVADRDGNTVLHRVAAYGDAQTLGILEQHGLFGLDTAKRNALGLTAAETFDCRSDLSYELVSAFNQLLRAIEGASMPQNHLPRLDDHDDQFYDALEEI